MISRRFAKRVLVFSAACVTNSAVQNDTCVCKPSDLPIYTKDPVKSRSETCEICIPEPSALETGVGSVRQNVFKLFDELNRISAQAQEIVQQGLSGADELVTYLRKEENVTPKYGAIAIGGLAGLVFAARGGMFKKFVYTSTGAAAMAALCYPKEASKYANLACGYATIAMNFAYGVKKDDPSLQIPSIKTFSNSVGDAWNKIKSFSSTVTDKSSTTGPEHENQLKDLVAKK